MYVLYLLGWSVVVSERVTITEPKVKEREREEEEQEEQEEQEEEEGGDERILFYYRKNHQWKK